MVHKLALIAVLFTADGDIRGAIENPIRAAVLHGLFGK